MRLRLEELSDSEFQVMHGSVLRLLSEVGCDGLRYHGDSPLHVIMNRDNEVFVFLADSCRRVVVHYQLDARRVDESP